MAADNGNQETLFKLTTWVEEWRFFLQQENKIRWNRYDYLSRFPSMIFNASIDFS
ncbi:hypothetical protein C2845_PM16G02450 [Panicum miliaceum]|uniref:Uncharacterized protein n=1 Tax=Panicum miliaceum TaxID=4540 RepID=A0A3L6PS52_PANMI|nr:hypothetical protein C2845_PM16G02450 [Panicum miliaceum]